MKITLYSTVIAISLFVLAGCKAKQDQTCYDNPYLLSTDFLRLFTTGRYDLIDNLILCHTEKVMNNVEEYYEVLSTKQKNKLKGISFVFKKNSLDTIQKDSVFVQHVLLASSTHTVPIELHLTKISRCLKIDWEKSHILDAFHSITQEEQALSN